MTLSPIVERRVFAEIIRRYREQAGIDARDAARRLGWDPHKVYRWERREFTRIPRSEVDDLLSLYGVDDGPTRAELAAIAERARSRGWWQDYTHWQGELAGLEAGASTVATFDALCVPGLFQTPDYAAVVVAAAGYDEPEVRSRVAARMRRQEAFFGRDERPKMSAVIDEGALTKVVGSAELMREQVRQLVELATWPGVNIRVVRGAHAGMAGSFTHLAFVRARSVVYLEAATTASCLESSDEVARYEEVYDRLLSTALPVDESVLYMASIVDGLTPRGGSDERRGSAMEEEHAQRIG